MKIITKAAICGVLGLSLATGCGEQEVEEEVVYEEAEGTETGTDKSIDSQVGQVTPAIPETSTEEIPMNDFCDKVAKVNIVGADFSKEIALLCNGDKKTNLFESLVNGAFAGGSSITLNEQSSSKKPDTEETSLTLVYGRKVSKTLLDIRALNSYDALLGNLTLPGNVVDVAKVSEEKLNGLRFQTKTLKIDTVVKLPQGASFENSRETQVNDYQVAAGREDLAFSTEHLLKAKDNSDFSKANTLTVSLGNKSGTESYLISVVSFTTWNRGFHDTNVNSLKEITKAQAMKVYDRIK